MSVLIDPLVWSIVVIVLYDLAAVEETGMCVAGCVARQLLKFPRRVLSGVDCNGTLQIPCKKKEREKGVHNLSHTRLLLEFGLSKRKNMGNSLNQEAAPAKSEKSEKSKKSTKNPVAEEPSSTAEPRRRSSSATSMVDSNDQPRRRSSSAAAPASFYVTPEEREHIKMLYALLWPREKDYLDEEFLITLLTSYNMAPTLAKTMKSIFATAKFKNTYEGFEDFLIECTRTSSTASLHIIWKFTRFLAISEDKFDWTSRCKRFCALLLLFSTGKEPASEEELYHSATELAAFYTQIVHRNDTSVDCDVDFNTLQNAVHVYSPQAARPLQALFATIFFHADESPSFHPYVPPQTSTQSTLLNDFAAGFLAMAGEPLQGSWKCLYTMATDGISFNRIVHHVLGYDVRSFQPLIAGVSYVLS